MPDQLVSPVSGRARTVLKRNASSRSSMIAASAVSFFKQSIAHQQPLAEDSDASQSDGEPDDALFYDTVYPLVYDRELVTFDILDHYFLTAHLGGPTLHRFENEPLDVLDIGCGAGTWIIDTARAWILTHFVGFDVNIDMHPSLDILHPPDLRERIRWMQGDFLERLPFPNQSFDFVRVSKISLAVPEAKWPRLIGEISRVLRPGGTFEIVEENLIFPLPNVRPLKPSPLEQAANAQAQAQSQGSDHSSTVAGHGAPLSLRMSASPDHSVDPPLSSPRQSGSSSPPPYAAPDLPEYTPRGEATSAQPSPLDLSDRDPRDHRKLKRAWDAMLAARGINSSPLSILSLYILAEFEHLESSSAPITVTMPGPSRATLPNYDSDASDADSDLSLPTPPAAPPPPGRRRGVSTPQTTSVDAPLHLLRGLATVLACRDSLLPHFQQLYPSEHTKERVDTHHAHAAPRHNAKGRPRRRSRRQAADRHEFDAMMSNYERDLLDRVGMGQRLVSSLGWKPPAKTPKAKDAKDEFSRWREDIRLWRSYEQEGAFDPDIDMDICRTLRIFSATKRDT
ncbi:hypothetical protein AURDEDRAFT_112781, partial [Auricularia subglabra TFB-10046 SS5]